MQKIESLRLTRLRNDEHFEFVRHIGHIVDGYGAAAIGVEPQRAALKAAFADEDAALRKIAESVLTAKIADADRARDEIYNGLVNAVRSAKNHYKPATREAADRLWVVMKVYRGAAGLNFEEETSAILNLLTELMSGAHAADCEALDLVGWIGELDRRNNEFERLMEQRTDELSGRPTVEMTVARRAVDAAYGALSDIVYARALVAGMGDDAALTARFAELIARWNETIDRAHNILARRAPDPKKKPDGEQAAPDGEGETKQ